MIEVSSCFERALHAFIADSVGKASLTEINRPVGMSWHCMLFSQLNAGAILLETGVSGGVHCSGDHILVATLDGGL